MNLQVGDNMDFLLGLLVGVILFVVIGLSLYIGFRIGKKNRPTPQKIDEQEEQRIKKFNNHFKALFSYDVDTALQRKKVTE